MDLDGDGDLDVLVTNGDMLDDFQLKPYHSIRWLENKGSYPYVPHELAHMFGVMRAQAADLDGDGDLDIVACALVQFSVDGQPRGRLPTFPPSSGSNKPRRGASSRTHWRWEDSTRAWTWPTTTATETWTSSSGNSKPPGRPSSTSGRVWRG